MSFFTEIRKSKKTQNLLSTMARDPEGLSRIQKESFQQVFDRMENDLITKPFEFGTLIEYFTKRGRPLTKTEIEKLQQEDFELKQQEEDD